MRLVYINPQAIPGLLPSTIQALQVVDGFAQTGDELIVITPAPENGVSGESVLGHDLSPKLRFEHLPTLRKRWYFPYSGHKVFYWQASRRLKEKTADAVYVRNLKLAEVLLKNNPEVPLFFETHELFAQSFIESGIKLDWRNKRKHAQLARREAFVYQHARGLIALTEALATDIRERYAAAAPILVAADGVDLPAARAARPESPGAKNSPPVLLYLGSLHKWKGVEIAVEALPSIPQARLMIAGGPDERIAELKARAALLGVQQRIDFLGKIAPATRFNIIQQADICLLPLINTSIGSRYTSPLKLFEYMAMGKAIVASRLPSVMEVLSDEVNGCLVEAENPAAWANAVLKLLADDTLRAELGRQALQDSERFAWNARANQCRSFMNELLA